MSAARGLLRAALLLAGLAAFGTAPHDLLGGPTAAAAHEVRPGYLELREKASG